MNKSRMRAPQPLRPRALTPASATRPSTIDGDALQRLAIEGRRTPDSLRSIQGLGNRAVQRLVSGASEESELFNVPDVDLPAPGGGETIPDDVRTKMEGAFGQDFSDVRVHTSSAPASIDALAYTQGHDIHFSPGQFNPASTGGQEALGHELAHVVQQRSGRVASPDGPGAPVNAQATLEAEADALGQQAAHTDAPTNLAPATAPSSADIEESAQRIAVPVQRNGRGRRGSVDALEQMQLVSSRRGMFEGGGMPASTSASPSVAEPAPGAPEAAVAPPSAAPEADAAAITEAPGGAAALADAVPATDAEGVPEGADEVEETMGSDTAAAAAAASELAATIGPDEALATIAEGGESEEDEGEESPASGAALTTAPSTASGIASALGLPAPVPTPETVVAAEAPSSTPVAVPSTAPASGAVPPAVTPTASTSPMVVETSSAEDNWWDAPAPGRARSVEDTYGDTAGLGMTVGGGVATGTGVASTVSGMAGASTFDTGQVSNIAGAPGGLLGAGASLAEAASASRAAHLSSGGAQVAEAGRATSALTSAAASTASAATSIEAARVTAQSGNVASLGSGANAVMTGAGTAAAGLSVATGSIDVIRGVGGAVLADSRQRQLEERSRTFGDARARGAASATAETQRQAFWDSTATATKGAITVAGGAILLALGLSNPIGLGLLAGAAIAGGAYALYKWFRGRGENKKIKGGVSEKQAKMELAVTLFESGVKDGIPEYRQILKDLGFKAKKVDAGLAGGITASDILKKIS